jgi:hypothetical protein
MATYTDVPDFHRGAASSACKDRLWRDMALGNRNLLPCAQSTNSAASTYLIKTGVYGNNGPEN